jgi:hypothetical protein
MKDSIETVDNPFENKFHIESIPKRPSKSIAKRRRNRIKLDDDPEINDLLRIYGDRVNVLK